MSDTPTPKVGPHLVYFADPMCSWCWGFSPVIGAIRERFRDTLPIRLVLGGLRPGTTEPMTEQAKAEIREHWTHVHEASGQNFDHGFFEREGFVYDTEPASRAVAAVRRRGMEAGLDMLAAVQRAFYAENRDVTREETLAHIAAAQGVDDEAFRTAFESEAAQEETVQDFAIAQQAGVRGFPTLIAGTGESNEYALVTQGFQRGEVIVPALENWLAEVSAAKTPGLVGGTE